MPVDLRVAVREVKHSFEGDLHSLDVDADLRLLRYFVAVAEELHFTRAAARLHMAQQPLSAAIRRLEADLGVELFRRTTRQVELTQAGRALLEPARAALRAAADALAAARAAASGVAGELQFGLSAGARYGLEPLFAALAERHPALHLHVHLDGAGPLIADVRAGQLDIAVTFGAQVPAELESERLRDEPVVVAVAVSHPLASRDAVSLGELRGETFSLDMPGDNPDYDNAVIQACRLSGFEPRTRASAAVHDSWEGLIFTEGCVGLTVRTSVQSAHRNLRLLPLREPLTFPLDLVWARQAAVRPALEAVIATARDVRQQQGWR
jgi:DNA-binding transcriptional LysR family regulator